MGTKMNKLLLHFASEIDVILPAICKVLLSKDKLLCFPSIFSVDGLQTTINIRGITYVQHGYYEIEYQ